MPTMGFRSVSGRGDGRRSGSESGQDRELPTTGLAGTGDLNERVGVVRARSAWGEQEGRESNGNRDRFT